MAGLGPSPRTPNPRWAHLMSGPLLAGAPPAPEGCAAKLLLWKQQLGVREAGGLGKAPPEPQSGIFQALRRVWLQSSGLIRPEASPWAHHPLPFPLGILACWVHLSSPSLGNTYPHLPSHLFPTPLAKHHSTSQPTRPLGSSRCVQSTLRPPKDASLIGV